MKVTLPETPLIARSKHACVIESAQSNFYVYSSFDDRFYLCNKPETALREVEDFYSQSRSPRFGVGKDQVEQVLDEKIDYLLLNVTDQCNLRCTYCAYSGQFAGERSHGTISMSRDIADRALLYYSNHSAGTHPKKIGFYGGEPFLEFELIEYVVLKAVELFGRDDVSFFLTTNGCINQPNISSFLADNNMVLSVSIDGPSNVHDTFRLTSQGFGSWKMALDFVKELKKSYREEFFAKVGLSVTIADPKDFEAIHDFLSSHELLSKMRMHVGLVDWSRSRTQCLDSWDHLSVGHSYLDAYCTQVISGGKENHFLSGIFDLLLGHIWARPIVHPNRLWPGGSCIPGGKRLFVSSSGKFYPCERVGVEFPIGDCYRGIIVKEVIHYLDQLASAMTSHCGSCWAVRLCSVCLANARWNGVVSHQRIQQLCERIKWQISYLLSAYISVIEISPHKWTQRFRKRKNFAEP